MTLLSIILIIAFWLLPVYLWWYGVSLLSSHEWNRIRFFYGLLGGWLSVGIIYMLWLFLRTDSLMRLYALLGVIGLLLVFVWIATLRGSAYVRVFLRKLAFLHAGIFIILYLLIEGMTHLSPHMTETWYLYPLVSGLVGYMFAWALEEWVKHLSTVWLTAKEFRFSRRDLLVFWFFITLWFVMVENLLYLIQAYRWGVLAIFSTGITRSVFSLLAHLFAASICIIFWWKALSYGVFSWKYIFFFVSGFLLASIVHTLYNTMISLYGILPGAIVAVIAYIFFTQWLVESD